MKAVAMSALTVGCPVEAGGASGGSPSAKTARNRAAMRLFEKCINTNDLELGRRLISEKAAVALKAASDEAVRRGYRLKIYDAYRPQRAVAHFTLEDEPYPDTYFDFPVMADEDE